MTKTELSDPDAQLNNARINLRECVHRIDELLQGRISPSDRNSTIAEIASKAEWAIQYLYRGMVGEAQP